LEQIINPYILYGLCALGAVGVCLALPRRGRSPQIIGALLAALAGAGALVALALKNPADLPNIYFYIFSAIALGAALRVITHPRPVYAALYFVLTVIASGGLFLILSAEFMALAMIIVYAGAILITYLFVIMLATQAPKEGEIETLTGYDTQAREPVAATVVGFVLVAVLTSLIFGSIHGIGPVPTVQQSGVAGVQGVRTIEHPDALLAEMPRRVERAVRSAEIMPEGHTFRLLEGGRMEIDPHARTVTVVDASGAARQLPLPDDLVVTNTERVGFNLLRDHPGAIEIAGVILLMAMLGAVVLSRKQVQIDEEAKLHQQQTLATTQGGRGGGGA